MLLKDLESNSACLPAEKSMSWSEAHYIIMALVEQGPNCTSGSFPLSSTISCYMLCCHTSGTSDTQHPLIGCRKGSYRFQH